MSKTGIPYLDGTISPVVGCDPAMPCNSRCWAWRQVARQAAAFYGSGSELSTTLRWKLADRFPRKIGHGLGWSGKCVLIERRLELMAGMTGRIGVCFHGDLFARGVSDEWIDRVFKQMAANERATWFVLTKQIERMAEFVNDGQPALPHVWLGVSVCNQADWTVREPWLTDHVKTKGWQTWASLEPLLGDIQYEVRNAPLPDWTVVGCESGKDRRACNSKWVEHVTDLCTSAHYPVYVKQLSSGGKVIYPGDANWPEWAVQQLPV